MQYRKGYKYILAADEVYKTGWFIGKDIKTDFIEMTRCGDMTLKKYYASDGCSGLTWDDKTNMRAGFGHDGLCQLLRLGHLEQKYLPKANEFFKKCCLEDGMNKVRAAYYLYFVSRFGAFAARPGYEPYPVLTAP